MRLLFLPLLCLLAPGAPLAGDAQASGLNSAAPLASRPGAADPSYLPELLAAARARALARDRAWLRLYDDRIGQHYFAMAEGLRVVPPEELTPISPEVPPTHKRIEVSLQEQMLRCFEGSTEVFTARVSCGARFDNGDFSTPVGAFTTFRKRGSRHMAAGNRATGYDLPGVPWVSYITQEGVSFHGTYWHNDYGTPRSHGCINMTPSAAKWLYRWTHPIVPGNLDELWTQGGTDVRIT